MTDAICFYFQERPRSFALRAGDYALVFLYSDDEELVPRCIVEFCPWQDVKEDKFRQLTPPPIYGCLGLINSGEDVFLCLITGCSKTAVIRKGETANKIFAVEFYCINNSKWDNSILGGYDVDQINLEANIEIETEQLCSSLQRLLTDGTFYFSADCDLTTKLQSRPLNADYDIDSFDESFMWNKYMMGELLTFRSHLPEKSRKALDRCRFLTTVIRGFVETLPCKANMNMTIISRLSCRRAGTRFNSRGIDDEGNVANFVETETLLQNSASCFSFCQIRGSVPIFWEQVGTQLLGQKIQIPRFLEATQPAFEKHLESLIESYGPVHVINLLGSKGDEPTLSDRYERHLRNLGDLGKQTKYTTFDFHAEVRIGGYENANVIREVVGNDAESYAFYLEDNDMITMKQTGIFRTNCLDCLDRTNLIQGILSQMAIEGYLIQRKIVAGVEFWRRHNILWADNGDALSRIYAGTNALKTSYTRKGKSTFVGALSDVTKSFGRLYINQFLDKERQVQIDFLLGRLINQRPVQLFDPISDHVNQELSKRAWEFSSTTEIKIFTGTYNLNGRISEESIEPWLHPDDSPMDADLVAVGFQEIVELTAQQIVNADPAKREYWEQRVLDTLNKGKNEYVILRSGQLVGAALMLFGKSSSLSAVKNIECSIRKTGLKGMSGNKGGVSIRLDYENTRLCFITAHFAAGHANFQERDDDYRTIAHGLKFQRGRTIEDHDAIIWLGDFNYRIALMNDDVRHYINKGDIGVLFTNDQLNLQMSANKAFTGYQEAQITFLPTYKFDNGTDDYDSSEKQRIPAWTDRILSRGSILEQTAYYSAPLRFSDHRPVYALFTATITKIDEDIREQLAKELYNMRKTKVGDDPALKQPKKPKPPPPKSRNASSARAETFSLAPTGDLISFKPGLPPKPRLIPIQYNVPAMESEPDSPAKNTVDTDRRDRNLPKQHANPPPRPSRRSATIQEAGESRPVQSLQRPNTVISERDKQQARIESAERENKQDQPNTDERRAPPLPPRIGRSKAKFGEKLKCQTDLALLESND